MVVFIPRKAECIYVLYTYVYDITKHIYAEKDRLCLYFFVHFLFGITAVE